MPPADPGAPNVAVAPAIPDTPIAESVPVGTDPGAPAASSTHAAVAAAPGSSASPAAAAASRTVAAAHPSPTPQRVDALVGAPLHKSSLNLGLGIAGGAALVALLVWAVVQPPRTALRRRSG